MGKLYRKSYGGIRLTRDEKLAIDAINAGISLLKGRYRGYKLRKSEAYYKRYGIKPKEQRGVLGLRQVKRLEKAQVIKRIINSDLPESTKKREIAKLSGITAQTRLKGLFFKLKRTPRELRQASEANF